MSKPLDVAYQNIRQILEDARRTAYTAVNVAMVQAYWNIGRIIVEEEQGGKTRAGYGEYLLKELSVRLTNDFGKGFDEGNLRNMRKFNTVFPMRDAVHHELSWTQYRLLLKVEKYDVRQFYISECIQNNWSTLIL